MPGFRGLSLRPGPIAMELWNVCKRALRGRAADRLVTCDEMVFQLRDEYFGETRTTMLGVSFDCKDYLPDQHIPVVLSSFFLPMLH